MAVQSSSVGVYRRPKAKTQGRGAPGSFMNYHFRQQIKATSPAARCRLLAASRRRDTTVH